MDLEEELLQMHSTNVQNTSHYKLLLATLEAGHFAAFKSFINKALKKHDSGINVDYIFPDPYNKTFLDIACSEGLRDFVELLLELGANPNRINEAYNRAPLHFATENQHVEVLQILLEDPAINPNLEVGRQTAFHIAVKNKDLKCVEALLSAGARPDIVNAKGITPLHQAASTKQKEIVQLILNTKYPVPLDIDTFRDFRGQTARDVLLQNFPDQSLPEQKNRKVDFNLLRYYLDANDEKNFLENLSQIDQSEAIDFYELVKIASEHNLSEAIVKLISREELVEMSEAAEIAVRRGHYEVLKKILNHDRQVGKKLILVACQELSTPCRRSVDHQKIRLKCLKIILKQKDIDVRVEDEKGNTPLHYAARAENAEAVDLLLQAGSYIGHLNRLGVPPLAHMCPKTLDNYFNSCINSSNERSDDYEINFDYQCLMPNTLKNDGEEPLLGSNQRNSDKNFMEMQTLRYIAETKALKHLLKHPLLTSFLFIKWSRIRYILYANLFFYLVFYVLLNTYIILVNSKDSELKTDVLTAQEGIFLSVTVIAIVILAGRELCQCLSSPGHYLMSFENWFEVALIVLAGVFLVNHNSQIGAIVILLSAWELVILIGQLPKMSTGIEIFKTVSLNFIKFLILYAFLILSFALAFYILLKDDGNQSFVTAPQSIFKTIVMLTGEFEAGDIPFHLHPVLGHLIFVLFEFLIAIVLFNLLTGLAVSDTQEILSEAELVSLISRTKLISYIEGVAVGLPFYPKNRVSCCLQPIFRSSRFNPLYLIAKRILVFKKFLPEGKLSVKPYKNHEIVLQGRRSFAKKAFPILKLDSSITTKAKSIIAQREYVSKEDKIISKLESIFNKRLDKIESLILNLGEALEANKNNEIIDS